MRKRTISLVVSLLFVLSFALPVKANTDIKVIACNGPFNTITVYDRVHVVEYYQVSSGSYAVGIDTYYDMPTGWAFDLRA